MTRDIDPHLAYVETLEALRIGQLPRQAAWRWLLDGLDSFANGEHRSLEAALSIDVGPGGAYRRLSVMVPRLRRDRALAQLANRLTGTNAQRATSIARALANLESQEHRLLPDQCHQTLIRLNQEHPDIPRSRTQLQRIIEGDSVAQRAMCCSDNRDYSNNAPEPPC